MTFQDGPYLTKEQAERFSANLDRAIADGKVRNEIDRRGIDRIIRRAGVRRYAQRMLVALAIGIIVGVLFSV